MMYGTLEGTVVEMEIGGSDQGSVYTFACVPLFEDVGTPTQMKRCQMARLVYLAPTQVNERLSFQNDYTIRLPPAPDETNATADSVWGAGVWGTSEWGAAQDLSTFQDWRSLSGEGRAVSIGVQISSGRVAPAAVEMVRIDMLYDTAASPKS